MNKYKYLEGKIYGTWRQIGSKKQKREKLKEL